MASVTLSVTVTDTVNHPLVTIRDTVLIALNYPGGGTAQDKLNFIQSYLAKHLKMLYIQQLDRQRNASPIAVDAEIDIQ